MNSGHDGISHVPPSLGIRKVLTVLTVNAGKAGDQKAARRRKGLDSSMSSRVAELPAQLGTHRSPLCLSGSRSAAPRAMSGGVRGHSVAWAPNYHQRATL